MSSPVSILPHEDVILSFIARKIGLKYMSRAGYTIYDAVNDINLALSYVMLLDENSRCVFLNGSNLCLLHEIYKPYICRSYPYVPRQVKYTFDEESKWISAQVDYGLSTSCPVVERDKGLLEKYFKYDPRYFLSYIEKEYTVALEMESDRQTLLSLLSYLWRTGIVELQSNKAGSRTVNLYEFLREYFPDLPSRLYTSRYIQRIKDLSKG